MMGKNVLHNLVLLSLCTLFLNSSVYSKNYTIKSPDNKIEIRINTDGQIKFSVFQNAKELIAPSPVSLTIYEGAVLGLNPVITETKTGNVDNVIEPVIKQKSARIKEQYNELKIICEGNYGLTFRAYNEGAAYRFETSFPGELKITAEEVTFNFAENDTVYFPHEESFMSHNERLYEIARIRDLKPDSFCSLPVLIGKQNGTKVLITEAELTDYPGLWLKVKNDYAFSGIMPKVALKENAKNDRDIEVVETADYIAETKGTRALPWRVMAVAENDGDLILNQMVYLLSEPLQLKETDWIKPGKVAWDWWNALNIYGVNFDSGLNTDTYKYYIDFASKYGIEYVILDEGWYKLGDLTDINPDIDIEELLKYAKEKNVGIILWVVWKTLDNQLTPALDRFEEWGVKGIKVDFMQRDDQAVVNYYQKIAEEAAKRKMLVDFHGSYKPTGLRRAYPNVITREGVRGLEHCKWSKLFIPGHEVTLPFIRMVAGPMDYTPGAMNNSQAYDYRVIFNRPMSMGTRCHQLAMYVVYESPLQMLADNPSNYLRESESMSFLSKVPSVWDETVVLNAKVADYITLARRNGNTWYVGAMTDEKSRELVLNLSFLGAGEYNIEYWQDGINSEKYAEDFDKISSSVTRDSVMKIKLASGGGWAAIISKK